MLPLPGWQVDDRFQHVPGIAQVTCEGLLCSGELNRSRGSWGRGFDKHSILTGWVCPVLRL